MSGGGGPRRSSLCGHYDEPWGTASDDRRRPHLVPSVMDPAGCVGLVGGTVGDELPHYVPSELQVSRRATVPRARQGSGIPPTLRPPVCVGNMVVLVQGCDVLREPGKPTVVGRLALSDYATSSSCSAEPASPATSALKIRPTQRRPAAPSAPPHSRAIRFPQAGAAGRARAVVEGAITPALRPRPPPKRARATPTRASGNRVCLQPREGWLAAWREPPRPSRH